jgi:predicted Zn-dependent protease
MPANARTLQVFRYHSTVKLRVFFLIFAFLWRSAVAQDLPDLGDSSQAILSPGQELMIGNSIMSQIRSSPDYLDDPDVTDYLNQVGFVLVSNSPNPGGHFEFFAVKDKTINAFALPGGFIGVHTGLILSVQSESELVGVLGHEIAHVTQHHIARMMAIQKQGNLAALAGLALAILAARSNAQLSQAAVAASQAAPLQSQLSYSRDHEREADRIGLQIVEKSHYDPHAVPSFFERLQRATQVYGSGAPSYLQSHPLTYERIADMEGRVESMPYHQVPDSLAFHLVRARLTAIDGSPEDAVATFKQRIAQKKYANELAPRYGYIVAVMREGDPKSADLDVARDYGKTLLQKAPDDPMVLALAAKFQVRSGQVNEGVATYEKALALFPTRRALMYGYARVLLDSGQFEKDIEFLDKCLTRVDTDPHLYELKAQAHAALGQRLAQHSAQAEALFLKGNLGAAIEQLRIAQTSGDGDFYQKSSVDARLREFKSLDAQLRGSN